MPTPLCPAARGPATAHVSDLGSSLRERTATAARCLVLLAALGAGLMLGLLTAARADEPEAGLPRSPLSPEQALAEFRLEEGLQIELVASEPLIESPVKLAFDERGRIWLVEMLDYPNGPPPGEPPAGRIKVLEDRDGDGRFEHATVFADHLLFANGVLPWRDGAIVTSAPEIVWLRDIDQSGRADARESLYVGFAAENPQLRVSHPTLGVDNWVYVANGLRGGQVRRSGARNQAPIKLGAMDFRFDPVHDRGEAVSGMGQFGLTFDEWGQRFVCDNHHHLRHVVLPNRYLRRNPYLAVPEVVEDTSILEPGQGGAGAKVYPISRTFTTSSLHSGHFTAACGVTIYTGDLLPAPHRGAAFTCDPTGNLVHEEVLEPLGATFRSRPAHEGVEFLASRDSWFRPVSLAIGPDGALYVVDMYRAVIEHPEYMPPELKHRPDLKLGRERGRIWRIAPRNAPRGGGSRPQLASASPRELVGRLGSPNGWWRTSAQRLILQAQDTASVTPLRDALWSASEPVERMQAAWLLDSLGELGLEHVLRLLHDAHPRVREHAVRLGERFLATSPSVQERVVALANDPDARVRFQVALSLGEWDDDRIVAPLARIAAAGADDRWSRLAVASAVPTRSGRLLAALVASGGEPPRGAADSRVQLLRELAAIAGARGQRGEETEVLASLARLEGPAADRLGFAVINGLAEGMSRHGDRLSTLLDTLQQRGERVRRLFQAAGEFAHEANRDPAERIDAIRLLAHAPWSSSEPVLAKLLSDDPNQAIRVAAARALAAHGEPEVVERLLAGWRSYTPAVRREVTDALLRQPQRADRLLDELEEKRILPGDLDAQQARVLLNTGAPERRARARKLLQESLPQERKAVLERYHAALELKSEPERGRRVFEKTCATCHRVANLGVDVGPDIADTRVKTREALLADILNPNQAIDGNYVAYVVATRDGNVLTGVVLSESAQSLTLRRAEGKTDTILRQDIEELRSTGQSLMPEGLEKDLSLQDMADLIDFLKNWRYLDGTVPAGTRSAQARSQAR